MFGLISTVEGTERLAYYDQSRTNDPTIGLGFNLRSRNVRDKVMREIGFVDVAELDSTDPLRALEQGYIDQIQAVIEGNYATDTALQNALDAVMTSRANDAGYQGSGVTLRTTFSFSAGQTGVDEMSRVFDQVIVDVEGVVDVWLQSVVGESPTLSIGSKERAVFVSLAYNSRRAWNEIAGRNLPTLLGPSLARVITESGV